MILRGPALHRAPVLQKFLTGLKPKTCVTHSGSSGEWLVMGTTPATGRNRQDMSQSGRARILKAEGDGILTGWARPDPSPKRQLLQVCPLPLHSLAGIRTPAKNICSSLLVENKGTSKKKGELIPGRAQVKLACHLDSVLGKVHLRVRSCCKRPCV